MDIQMSPTSSIVRRRVEPTTGASIQEPCGFLLTRSQRCFSVFPPCAASHPLIPSLAYVNRYILCKKICMIPSQDLQYFNMRCFCCGCSSVSKEKTKVQRYRKLDGSFFVATATQCLPAHVEPVLAPMQELLSTQPMPYNLKSVGRRPTRELVF